MAKLKAGEWFMHEGNPALLVSTKPAWDGEPYLPVMVEYSDPDIGRANTWLEPATIAASTRLNRKPLIPLRSAKRADGFKFYGFHSETGRKALIVAGCRAFTLGQAFEHWTNRHAAGTLSDPVYREALNIWSLRYVTKLKVAIRAARAA